MRRDRVALGEAGILGFPSSIDGIARVPPHTPESTRVGLGTQPSLFGPQLSNGQSGAEPKAAACALRDGIEDFKLPVVP